MLQASGLAKKIMSFVTAASLVFSAAAQASGLSLNIGTHFGEETVVLDINPAVLDMANTRPTADIHIRDPFILVYGQQYFMYGTGAAQGPGYGCYVSEDLENWAGPVNVFSAPAGYDGINCFWAPECHYYNGSFYLFATYFSQATQHRGVSVYKADSPLGPFTEISAGHITPHSWDSIDGTLYIDPEGQPWMVFVHEWTSMPDQVGAMAAAKLSEDFSCFISEPVQLFKANDPVWTNKGITDGPFLYRSENGQLLMLWSNFDVNGKYCVSVANTCSNEITGKWTFGFKPFYQTGRYFRFDGGHPMLFTDLNGTLLMCMHSPNSNDENGRETAVFLEVDDKGDSLELVRLREMRAQEDTLRLWHGDIAEFFTDIFLYIRSDIRQLLKR